MRSVLQLLAAPPHPALQIEASSRLRREGTVLDVVAVVERGGEEAGAAGGEHAQGLTVHLEKKERTMSKWHDVKDFFYKNSN